jgi:hypothetical protein
LELLFQYHCKSKWKNIGNDSSFEFVRYNNALRFAKILGEGIIAFTRGFWLYAFFKLSTVHIVLTSTRQKIVSTRIGAMIEPVVSKFRRGVSSLTTASSNRTVIFPILSIIFPVVALNQGGRWFWRKRFLIVAVPVWNNEFLLISRCKSLQNINLQLKRLLESRSEICCKELWKSSEKFPLLTGEKNDLKSGWFWLVVL